MGDEKTQRGRVISHGEYKDSLADEITIDQRGRSGRIDIETGIFNVEGIARAMTLKWHILSLQRITKKSLQRKKGRVEKARSKRHHYLLC